MKNITINAKEWFDRVNGNSYFSARISIDGEPAGVLPFQYGYGDHYVDMANQWLDQNGIIDNPRHGNGSREPLWVYCRDRGINLYTSKVEGCRKRDLDK